MDGTDKKRVGEDATKAEKSGRLFFSAVLLPKSGQTWKPILVVGMLILCGALVQSQGNNFKKEESGTLASPGRATAT